jgi:hypothetical protein
VLFAGEIIEESAFAEISGVGDVFDGGFGKALAGEEFESGAEEAFAAFGGTTFSAGGLGSGEGNNN